MADKGAAMLVELRRSCIHGYAHSTVADYLNVPGFVSIERNVNGGAAEKFYIAEFTSTKLVKGGAARLIALAGIVAECYANDPVVSPQEIADWISFDLFELSPTSAALILASDEGDVARCLEIVRTCWNDITQNAAAHAAYLDPTSSTQTPSRVVIGVGSRPNANGSADAGPSVSFRLEYGCGAPNRHGNQNQ